MEKAAPLAIILIAALLLVAALKLTGDMVAPVVLALVVGVVLSPQMHVLSRWGWSPAMAALTSVGLCLVVAGGVGVLLSPLIQRLALQAPKIWADLQGAIDQLRNIASEVTRFGAEIGSAMAAEESGQPGAEAGALTMPNVADALMLAPLAASQLMIFIGTLFFFLLTRDELYQSRSLPALRLYEAEATVSRYFITISGINLALGSATGVVLQCLGMPDAALWGVVAALVNFVVYLGPLVLVLALGFSGVAVFDGVFAALPAGAFLCLNFIEGQIVTPALVGRRMQINPLLVFLALIFGLWLWGPIGGVVALPVILWLFALRTPRFDV